MSRAFRDIIPRTLTAWQLTNDRSLNFRNPVNIGSELGGSDAPKLKFLFTVMFEFHDPIFAKSIDPGSSDMGMIKYSLKNATRPNININYADVNAYSYRFKVATRTDYGSVTLTFYDDNKNLAHNMLMYYLSNVSPISNLNVDEFFINGTNQEEFSSIGQMPHKDGIFKRMRVTHHYHASYQDGAEHYSAIHYDYMNPKIQLLTWDELDMTSSDANTIAATFVYDSVNIVVEHNYGDLGPDRLAKVRDIMKV